ncbi:MAG: helix-turn-helix domain-containing protein [Gemmatimonadota bacterium]
MMDIPYISATDHEVLRALGVRLRALRKARGLTQGEAAKRAELARSTVSDAERGENPTLQTLVRLLRVYGRLAALDEFLPAPEISPMERLRARQARSGKRADRPARTAPDQAPRVAERPPRQPSHTPPPEADDA